MPVVVQGAAGISCITAVNAVLTRPTVAAGDLMVVAHISDPDGLATDMTAPSGWTLLVQRTLAECGHLKIWTKTATGSEPATYTFPDSTSGDASAGMVVFRGHDAAGPFNAAVAFTDTTALTTSHPAPSVTGVVDGVLLTIHAAGAGSADDVNAARSYTPPAGMTEQVDTNNGGASSWVALSMNTLALSSSAATGTKTATISATRRAIGASVVIRPVGGTAYERTITDTVGITDTAAAELLTPVRRYLTNTPSAVVTSPAGGSWDDTTVNTVRVAGAAAAGAPVELTRTETSATADYDVLLGSYVTAPLTADATLSVGDAVSIATARRSTAGSALLLRYRVYVLTPAGTVRGTALDKSSTAGSFNETANPVGVVIGTTVATAVSCLAGDRIVLELGSRQPAATATAATSSIWAGGTDATPQVAGGTDINDPGYVDLPGQLQFGTDGTDYTRTVTDPVGVVDSATRTAAAARALTDPAGITDTVARTATADRSVTDPVGVVDTASAGLSLARTVTDPVGITDTAARTTGSTREVTDPVGAVDSLDVQLFEGELYQVEITDTVGIVDATAYTMQIGRTVTDPVGVADSTSRVAPASRSVTDPVGIVDSVTGEEIEPPGGEASTLTPDLFGVDWDTGALTRLPAWTRLALSPVRNDAGGISIDYPADAPGFAYLDAAVTADPPRVLQVEIRLGGSSEGRRRGFLVQKQSGNRLVPAGQVRFDGHFPEWLLDKALVAPQAKSTANPKGELLISALTYGAMLSLVIDQAQDRPGVLPGVSVDFTATHDSNGAPWEGVVTNLKIPPKTTVMQVAEKGVELGLGEFYMTPDLVLRAFNAGTRGVDRTTGGTPLTFAHAVNLAGHSQKESAKDAAGAVLAAGGEGHYAWATNATAIASLGFRAEAAVDAGQIDSDTAVLAYAQGRAEILGHGLAEYQSDVQLISTGLRPLLNYDVGDWGIAVTGTTRRRLRIAQIAVEFSRGEPPRVTVAQNDLVSDALAALIRRLNRLASGDAVIGTSTETPQEDLTVPNPPTGLVVSSEAFLEGPDFIAAVTAGWTPPTTNTDGSDLADLDGYLVQYRYATEPGVWVGVDVEDPTAVTAVFTAETARDVVVRAAAVDTSAHQSAWSDEVAHLTRKDDIPPPTPSTGTVSSRLGVGFYTWDGLGSAGEPMPIDLDLVEVHLSASQVFTADDTTLRTDATDGIAPGGGTFPLLGLPPGSTWWVAAVARDKARNRSGQTPSVQLDIARAIADDVADQIITAAKLGVGAVTTPKIAPEAVTTQHLSVAAFSDNTLPNGAFEDPDLADPTQPAGWVLGTVTGGLATLARDTTAGNVLSGTASARVSLSAASGTAELLSDAIPVSPGDVWYLEASARASRAVAAGLSIRVLLGATPTPTTLQAVTGGTGLALGTAYAEVPAGGANLAIPALAGGAAPRWMRLQLLVGGVAADAATLDVWVDELRARRVVGTAEIADAAISRAKIGLLAVGSAQIESITAGQINTGTLSAVVVLAGEFQTAPTGRRMRINGNGFEAFKADGTTLFAELDLASETMLVEGEYRTGLTGERLRLLRDGTMRIYGSSGTDYGELANEGGVWRARSRADANGRRSQIDFDPTGMRVRYGTATLTGSMTQTRTQLDVGLTYGVINAPVTGVRVWTQYSPSDGTQNRFHFVTANSGGDIERGTLHYRLNPFKTGGVMLNWPSGNEGSGLHWDNNAVAAVRGDGNAYVYCDAADFRPLSSELAKRDIAPIRHAGLSSLDIVDRIASLQWRYDYETEVVERRTVPLQRRQPDGTYRVEHVEAGGKLPEDRMHFFPIAEHLALFAPSLVHVNGQGSLAVGLRDTVGLLWDAVQTLSRQVKELRGDPAGPVVVEGQVLDPSRWAELPAGATHDERTP
jgi:hypothetical protein